MENKGQVGIPYSGGYPSNDVNSGLKGFRATTQQADAYHGSVNPTNPTQQTMLLTSTNIEILSNDVVVGMIQSFNVSESRNINKLQAIGVEGVVQAVPSNTNGGQLSVSRIALYQSNLWNALGLNASAIPNSGSAFKTLKEQRVPFQINVRSKINGTEDQYYFEKYIDCWLSSYSKSYTVQQITIAEQATIQYSDVVV